MKNIILGLLGAGILSGCVVTPVQETTYRHVYTSPGVAYVNPYYAQPAPGYIWIYNDVFGWGWHHHDYGWHRPYERHYEHRVSPQPPSSFPKPTQPPVQPQVTNPPTQQPTAPTTTEQKPSSPQRNYAPRWNRNLQ